MSKKVSDTPRRPRRPKKPIEPIHVEELLAGAGMNGFLGVLDPPVAPTHLENLVRKGDTPSSSPRRERNALAGAPPASLEISARVASVVSKVQALAELIRVKNRPGKNDPLG